MKKIKTLSILIVLVLLICSSCTGKTKNVTSDPAANPYPGTADPNMVTVDIQSDPPVLNSIISADSLATMVLQMSMTGLMKLDAEGRPAPGVAEKYEISDDQKTYTFHLRKDAYWNNGEPVTAADFLFAWRTTLNPATASPSAYILCDSIANAQEVYDGIMEPAELGVTAPDEYTLMVELADPIPYALDMFASPGFFPVNQKAYEAIGPDSYGTDADKIVTNGAYRITEWTHDNYLLMEKNDSYFNAGSIKIPKVKYVMLGDENTRMNAFKTGELDVFDIIGGQIKALESEGTDIVHAYYDNTVYLFQFNTKHAAIANSKICQALTMAIDTKSLCDNVFQDGSLPADGVVPPTISGAGGEAYAKARGSLIAYDKEQAKKLFAEGLKELQINPEELKLTYTAEDSSIGRMQAEYFQQQWAENLGLNVEINLMEWTALLQAQMNGDFDFTFSGWNNGIDDPASYLETFCTDNSSNIGAYQNPAYDELLKKAKTELDADKRQEYLIEAEKMLIESGAVLPLYYTRIVYAASAKVTGIACSGYQKYDFTAGAAIKQ